MNEKNALRLATLMQVGCQVSFNRDSKKNPELPHMVEINFKQKPIAVCKAKSMDVAAEGAFRAAQIELLNEGFEIVDDTPEE